MKLSGVLAVLALFALATAEIEVTQGQIKFVFDEDEPGLWVMELLVDGESTGRGFGARIFGISELAPATCDGPCDPWEKVTGRTLTRENDAEVPIGTVVIEDDEADDGTRSINVTAPFQFSETLQPEVTLHLKVVPADTVVEYRGLGGANKDVTVESDALEWGFTVSNWTLADSQNRFEFIYEVGSSIGAGGKWVILCDGTSSAVASDSKGWFNFGGSDLDPNDCRNNPDFGSVPVSQLTEVSLAPRGAKYAGAAGGSVGGEAAWRTVFEGMGTTADGESDVEVSYDRTLSENSAVERDSSDDDDEPKTFIRMRFQQGHDGPYHYDPVTFAGAGWLSASAVMTFAFAAIAVLATLF